MSREKATIILSRINERIDQGEFDSDLNIPFASRKLLKALVKQTIDEKVEKKSNPVLSDADIQLLIKDVRETAVVTAKLFMNMGILEGKGKTLQVSSSIEEKLSK